MINQFFIAGEIKKITISEPKDPKKFASAVLLVQYGVQRETTGGAVEFVNAVMVRVPSFKFPKLRDKLTVGQRVQITGKLQGVYKAMMNEGYFSTELVADRVDIEGYKGSAPAADSNAE